MDKAQKQTELTTNLKGCLQFKQNRLAEEDLPGFEAETTDLVLCQLNIFSRSGAFHFGKKKCHRSEKCHTGNKDINTKITCARDS